MTFNYFQVRQEAHRRYLKSAEKMANRYNLKNKIREFKVGEIVSLRIPRIDRTSSDLPRLPCIVVEVPGESKQLYRLRYGYCDTCILIFCHCMHGIIIELLAIYRLLCTTSPMHRCEHGVLKSCYPSGELEEHNSSLPLTTGGWKEVSLLSLREAARLSSPWNAFTANICKCTTGCTTRKCRCCKLGVSCSSHCHGGRSCHNKTYNKE